MWRVGIVSPKALRETFEGLVILALPVIPDVLGGADGWTGCVDRPRGQQAWMGRVHSPGPSCVLLGLLAGLCRGGWLQTWSPG